MGRLQTLFLEPAREGRWSKVLFHFSQLLHSNTNGWYDLVALRIVRSIRPPVELPPSKLFSPSEISRCLADLVERGWSIVDRRLTDQQIHSLWQFALTTPCYAGSDPTKLEMLSTEHLTDIVGRRVWRAGDVLQQDVVRSLITDSAFHHIAQHYIGCRPVLTNVTLWLDGGSIDTAAFHYHYDNDGPKFLKFFFFLSDVEEGAGAHYYVQRTHAHVKPRGFGRSDVHSDAEIWSRFGRENEISFAGKAGAILAEDTKGFHKGTNPRPGTNRLILQFQFAALDIPHIEEEKGTWKRMLLPDLPVGLRRIMQKFVA